MGPEAGKGQESCTIVHVGEGDLLCPAAGS